MVRRFLFLILAASLALTAMACGSDSTSSSADGGTPGAQQVTVRLGYFPNFTHAQAIVGLARNTFQEKLGPNVKVETKTFNAGPDEITALFAGEIDIGYIGPSPALNGYVKSKGNDVRIIAGAVSGGAELIVREGAGINSAADFANKRVASPQIGNTQDVALRTWLKANGLAAREQGGNVTVVPTQNADTLTLFQQGGLDAAWVPEPWGTRLINEAGGKLFLDERSLWPNGEFPTTVVIARTDFLEKNKEVVLNFLRGHIETTQWIAANPEEAKKLVNDGLQQLTGKALSQKTIDGAWQLISVTNDPVASSVTTSASNAAALGFLNEKPNLDKLFSLDLVNQALVEKNLPQVKGQ